MEKQVGPLTRLVDDLLDVSSITRGKIELRKERVELAAAVSRAVEADRPLAEARSHALTVVSLPQPVEVEADPTRLEQVIVNLLNNAIRYTRPGGHITLTAGRDGGEAVVRVWDTGCGISSDLLAKVFGLFTQGQHNLDRSEGGLGIGLTMVKRLVELRERW